MAGLTVLSCAGNIKGEIEVAILNSLLQHIIDTPDGANLGFLACPRFSFSIVPVHCSGFAP